METAHGEAEFGMRVFQLKLSGTVRAIYCGLGIRGSKKVFAAQSAVVNLIQLQRFQETNIVFLGSKDGQRGLWRSD
jgi:hypothetical protein